MGSPLPLRLLVTLYVGTFLVSQWIFAWLLQVIFIVISYPFIEPHRRHDICGQIFRFLSFFGMDFLNPFWTVKILRPFPETESKKILVMMNHLSGSDPFLVIRTILPRDCTFIAKDELFRVPFGGWCMSNADDLKVCFKNKRKGFETVKGSVAVLMEQARQKLNRGRALAIFPEGIRNKNAEGPLLPFRLGFFSLAFEEGATIIPLAISGTESCWFPGAAIMDRGTAYFSCGDPVEASKFKSAEELRDHVWNVVTELRESHPDRQAMAKKTE